MTFVQIVEITTARLSEVEALLEEWITKTEGRRSASRSLLGTGALPRAAPRRAPSGR